MCHTNYRGAHFVNDALPPYWLCRALIDRLSSPPPIHVAEVVYSIDDDVFEEDGPNRLADVNLREMFHTARQFVSHGEGLGARVNTYAPVNEQETEEAEAIENPSMSMPYPPMGTNAAGIHPEPMMPPMPTLPDQYPVGAW